MIVEEKLRLGLAWRVALSIIAAALLALTAFHVATAQADEGFSLQVSPSPLTATVLPGSDTTLELQIRNTNTTKQALKMGLRSFTIDDTTGGVKLGDNAPNEIQQLVHFENPTFTLQAGEIMTQRIYVHADANSGFAYNFAVTISQQNPPKATQGKSALAGSVAVFTLVNIDRPGATREVSLNSISVSKHTYEYLPAEISVSLKNTGNVNVQPTGTVFIQRNSNDAKPLAMLPLNQSGGFVLPSTSRNYEVAWSDGFPHYETVTNGTKTSKRLVWEGGLSNLRIGKYVAKVVAVYNDGDRDIPIVAEVSFWVIPWRILLGLLFVIVVLFVGIFVTARSAGRAVKKTSRKIRHTAPTDDTKK
ncbi:hypothetical protein KDA14_04385 [Candidatus Saccharibacteria bacterium]|nr:hypothetical protein [Candidatus Saccharibacteria bacterium]